MPKIDYLIATILLLGLLSSLPASSNQTLVESTIEEGGDAQYTYFKDQSDNQRPNDASMLFHIPGLTLTENGGPLGDAEIRYRGLAGSRFRVELEGLTLNNPMMGFTDANAMFLFAAQELQTTGQSLSITLPRVDHPFAKGLFGYGSHHAFKAGASTGTPLGTYSSLFVASQFSSTDGGFAFSSPDLKAGPDNVFYRDNNDHHRYQALVKFQRQAPTGGGHVLAAFNSHEGGLAGFAFSPTKHLRSQAVFAGLSTGFSKKINKAEFIVNLNNSVFNYQTTDIPIQNEKSLTSKHELSFSMKNLGLPAWLEFELGELLVLEQDHDHHHTRIGGGLFIKRNMLFKGRLKPRLSAHFNMVGYQHHGLLFKKDMALSIQPSDKVSITTGFARSQRLPTFMEMYASNRFFEGNPELGKESIWDLQLGTTIRFGNHTRLQLMGFMGYLSDVIVYVPFMATKIRPTNVETASRYGVDVGLTIEPYSWLLVESKNSLLRTKVKATNAPLPQAPPFLGLTRVRFGPQDLVALNLQSRYRGATNANYYGTKGTNSYMLFDVLVSAPVLKIFTLSLSVTNIFNVKHARDTYEMPLPGTVFFGQIEVGNS